jgi:glucans biosynthesis protein
MALAAVGTAAAQGGMDFSVLCGKAAQCAATPYEEPPDLPDALQKLGYDALRDIRFDTSKALWRMERLPFQVQGFHPGGIQKDRVRIHWMEGDVVQSFSFSPRLFKYPSHDLERQIPETFGFSGFRLHYPLNRPDVLDELIVFQGASYFRALCAGARYGMSARGLAVDTVASRWEEFPAFREFWIEKPDRSARSIRVLALLDGPSVVGAYAFHIVPGRDTVIEVRAMLFLRKTPEFLGLMPLTSMHWFGENAGARIQDYRPEVHDSDGLLIHTESGEWLWRPLVNEPRVRHSAFTAHHPKGFGLLQRDRKFESYEDLEAGYHMRPSVWIEPLSPWGEGTIRLIEFSTGTEYADNILACWIPSVLPQVGQPLEIKYRMHWFTESAAFPPLSRTLSTRISSVIGAPGARKFVLDFSTTPEMEATGLKKIELDLTVSGGGILQKNLMKNGPANTWRVVFDIQPDDKGETVELRCTLKAAGKPLTETWTYLWLP